jgi:hypothetical protein
VAALGGTAADETAAALRIRAGQTPAERKLAVLVGELATRGDATRAARLY